MNTNTSVINDFVICCFKRDLHLARICIASIRYFYPNATVYLLKDTAKGDFDTSEMETHFHAKVLHTSGKYFGWGFTKFEAFFASLDRFLLLDSDTVLTGYVLERLSKNPADFIVSGVETENKEDYNINQHYINIDKVLTIDPAYSYPGFGINTGQIVITPNKIAETSFENFIIRTNGKLHERYPGVFPYADQGVINYILAKAKQDQKINVSYEHFWLWSELDSVKQVDLKKIKAKTNEPFIIHWAGTKKLFMHNFTRYDILCFFENQYYQQLPFGKIKKIQRKSFQFLIATLRYLKNLRFYLKQK